MNTENYSFVFRRRKRPFLTLLILGFFLCASVDLSSAAEITEVLPPDRRILATSDPKANETIVYLVSPDGSTREVLWKMPRGFSAYAGSTDGNFLVGWEEYLPLDAGDHTIVLTFVFRGNVVRELTVKQLLGSRSNLRRILAPVLITDEAVRQLNEWRYRRAPPGEQSAKPRTDSDTTELPYVWQWGKVYGIDIRGFAFVDTNVGYFIFDVRTGKCVFPPNNPFDPASTR
jgi:hypothetical protein